MIVLYIVGFTTACVISTKVVSSNPTHCKVYKIQHYGIKFVHNFRHACQWFSQGTPVSSTNKTDHHDISEILLKVVLNTIILTLLHVKFFSFFQARCM